MNDVNVLFRVIFNWKLYTNCPSGRDAQCYNKLY